MSTYGSRTASHWGSEPGRVSLCPSRCKMLYYPLKLPLRRRNGPPGMTGIWASGRVHVRGISSCHRHGGHLPKRSRKTLACCIENVFAGGFEGSCGHHGGEVGMIFLAPFSSWSYFLHISFESKLLLERMQIKIKPVNKRKTETAGSSMKGKGGEVGVGRELPWQRTVTSPGVCRVRLLL